MPEDPKDMIISSYTDAQALKDGFLVDLGLFPQVTFRGLPINRMTRHLFDDLKPFFDDMADGDPGEFGRALASTLRTKCTFASGDPGHRRGRGYLPHPAAALAGAERGWRLDGYVPGGLLRMRTAARRNRPCSSSCACQEGATRAVLCDVSKKPAPERGEAGSGYAVGGDRQKRRRQANHPPQHPAQYLKYSFGF
jgi:hypothetical protein